MDDLLKSVEAFLERHPGVSATRLGKDSVRDPTFVFSLRGKDGKPFRQVTAATAAKVRAYMDGYEGRTPGRVPSLAILAEMEAANAAGAARRAAVAAEAAFAAAKRSQAAAADAEARALALQSGETRAA